MPWTNEDSKLTALCEVGDLRRKVFVSVRLSTYYFELPHIFLQTPSF